MDNLEHRLKIIFETTFPDVPADKITAATQENTQTWDSVAAITLMNLIEEEYEIQMDFEDLADLTSFEKVRVYLAAKFAGTKV
jgi:acyl carrier protein